MMEIQKYFIDIHIDILIDAIVGNNVRKESNGMEYLDIYDKCSKFAIIRKISKPVEEKILLNAIEEMISIIKLETPEM